MSFERSIAAPVLELTLQPHRSLSPTGFWIIMGLLAALSFIGGIVFWSIGAWPVIGFVGVDVALVYFAFKASYAGARAYEHVALGPERVEIRRVNAAGRESRDALPANWLKVEIERPTGRQTRLRLSTHGRSLVIGSFLSPEEREEVAALLQSALVRVRQGSALPG